MEREALANSTVELAVPQDEIIADFRRSQAATAAGGGLLFALVDAAVDHNNANKAERLSQSIQDQLSTYDYDSRLLERLSKAGAFPSWLLTSKVNISSELTAQQKQIILDQTEGPVILIQSRYSILPKFNGISAYYEVEAFDTDDMKQPVYKNVYTVQDYYSGRALIDKETNASYLNSNVPMVTRSLEFVQDEFLKVLKYDMNLGEATETSASGPIVEFSGMLPARAKIFKSENGVHWARMGTVKSIFVARGDIIEQTFRKIFAELTADDSSDAS